MLLQHHAVIQTDLQFNITGWNKTAETLHGQSGMMGKNLFSLVNIDFINSSRGELIASICDNGFWSGELVFHHVNGQRIYFRATATSFIDQAGKPLAVMIIGHIINDIKHKERQLEAIEEKYEVMISTLPVGVMMIHADGTIATCNKRGAEILGLTMEQVLGKAVDSNAWNAIKPDGSLFPVNQFPAIVSLQTGFPQRNVIMGLEQPGGMLVWLSVNSEALIKPGEFEPYAVVVSFSDISNFMMTEKELKKSNERFYYVTKVTSDAIWDLDLTTNEIYRSGAFSRLSGYSTEEIGANLRWWFNKIHPEDQERVKRKLDEELSQGNTRWEDEYRFEYADGSYKVLNDSGIILYKEGKPVRILGAIRDVTEEKELRKQLIDEQAAKQKAITQAAIQAQEEEKTKISRELHDNVNQILMSAKLYMDTAKRVPTDAALLLDKAVEYQLLALHEIRKISRSLSTPGIATTGLQDSISDIVYNLRALQHLEVEFLFDKSLEQQLQEDEKLTLYRVIQEQTSNIIKYAEATRVSIEVALCDQTVKLAILDNGKGFDSAVGSKGIGMINMNSRATAHNGSLLVISAPGEGCKIELSFPLS